MNNKPRSTVKGAQHKYELEIRRRPDEGDIYERYTGPYHNDERHDRYERSHELQQFHMRRSPEERYENAGTPQHMHVARIEIMNEPEDRWDRREVERSSARTRSQPNTERRGSTQQNSKPIQNASKIPPPPCMKNFADGYSSSSKNPTGSQQRQSESEKASGPKRRTRDEPQYNSNLPLQKSRYPESKTSSGAIERLPQFKEKPNKMVVVNMAKNSNASGADARAPAHRQAPSNPSLTKSQKDIPEKEHKVDHAAPQHIKNVQEVVQKMNSGEWPIKVNEEIVEVKIEVPPLQKQKNCVQREETVEKAKNWETLPRNRNSPQDHRQEGNNRELPQSKHKERSMQEEVKRMQKRRKHKDGDDSSEPSDGGEITTVSTDSAFGSEQFPAHSFEFGAQVALQHRQNVRELEFEAEKLLLYFKGHRILLNYLGIGLTETLWRRMTALPLCEMEIRPVEDTRKYSEHIDNEPKMVVMQVPNNDAHRHHSSNSKVERTERSLPAQSPRMVALERQLRTDDLNYDWEESSRGYSSDGEGDRRDGRRMDSRSGRFVKKSAAALIAKKQGFSTQHCLEQPSSSEIVDPRIASEIRALREREEELRRSRTELGLPTLDDVMSRSFASYHGGLRTAHSYDQLHQLVNAHCQNEHHAYGAHDQDRFIHAPQQENQRKKRKDVRSRQRSEERSYADRSSSRAVNQMDL